MFWPESVPGGCSVASDLPDSEAGVTIVVFQTSKDKRIRRAATNTGRIPATRRNSHAKENESQRKNPESRVVRPACQTHSFHSSSSHQDGLPRTLPVNLGGHYHTLAPLNYLNTEIAPGRPPSQDCEHAGLGKGGVRKPEPRAPRNKHLFECNAYGTVDMFCPQFSACSVFAPQSCLS